MVDNISHTHMKFLTLLLAACVGAAAKSLASETSVHVEGPSGILRGTMLSPAAGPGAPTVLIIPGSGPTDRDGNNPLGIRAAPYRFLAEALAGRGVTTLRFDKRGLFGSSAAARDANDVRMSDYAADVRAWMTAAQKWTTAPCAWIAGHSEGSLVALVAAQQPDGICGLILIAGAGRRLGNVLRDQCARILRMRRLCLKRWRQSANSKRANELMLMVFIQRSGVCFDRPCRDL